MAESEAKPEAPAKRGKLKLLLLGGAGLVLLLGGGGTAAWYFGVFGGAAAEHVTQGGPHAEGHGAELAPVQVAFVDMPDLIVNLQEEGPRLRYLKLRLSLEVAGEPAAEAVRQLMPRVMDSFQLYLRALTLEDVQGAAGMQRLKEELTARVNLAAAPTPVGAVLFKEMLVQ